MAMMTNTQHAMAIEKCYQEEIDRRRVQSIQQGPVYSGQMSANPYDATEGERFIRMIAMRLHLFPGEKLPVDHLNCARLNDSTIAAFIVKNGKYVVIEDDANLFPSDTLITQLRMLA